MTALTIEDVDAINNNCQQLLDAAVLLDLGLQHILDDDPAHLDPESIQLALLGVVQQIREAATIIHGRIELAGAVEIPKPRPAKADLKRGRRRGGSS